MNHRCFLVRTITLGGIEHRSTENGLVLIAVITVSEVGDLTARPLVVGNGRCYPVYVPDSWRFTLLTTIRMSAFTSSPAY